MSNKDYIDVLDVAKYFLYKSKFDENHYVTITPLKLQKLVYYAQAWYVTLNDGEKIFQDKIEAWVHGPVVRKLYDEYKKYGYNFINENVKHIPNSIKNNEKVKQILDLVWEIYHEYDAKTLEKLTHSEEPWRKARKGLPSYAASNNEISIETMQKYYGQYLIK